MNKQETYDFLDSRKIPYEATEHRAVFTMGEIPDMRLPHPECEAKNLFLRDDRKRNYYLITVKGEKRVDLKTFRKDRGMRPLTFASEEDLMQILELRPGSVTPLGLLSDSERKVKFFLDSDFFKSPNLIGIHPNENTATVWLKTEDLLEIIRSHGNETEIFNPRF